MLNYSRDKDVLVRRTGTRVLANRAGGKIIAAKYNWIIDSTPFRIALNAAAFAVWFGVALGLIFVAVEA